MNEATKQEQKKAREGNKHVMRTKRDDTHSLAQAAHAVELEIELSSALAAYFVDTSKEHRFLRAHSNGRTTKMTWPESGASNFFRNEPLL